MEEAARKMMVKEGEGKDLSRWDAYVDVCSGVVPSWADSKRPD